jgi:hypothetical protein
MRCTASDLTGDGAFQFSELQRDGTSARVDSYTVKIDEGWWHFDAVARLRWSGEANGTQSVSLYTANGSDSMTFDMSYPHSETVNISGELKAEQDGTSFVLGVLGVPVGMTVSLVDFGIHSIVGEGAGGKYNAGTGIIIDEPNRIISVDTDTIQEKLTPGPGINIDGEGEISVDNEVIQEKLTAGNGIVIDGNNEISVDTTVIATQADLATKQDVISDLSDIRAGAALGATAVQDPNYVHTDNNFTTGLKSKLEGLADIQTIGDNLTLTNGRLDAVGGDEAQVYRGDTEPTDENILIWIDTYQSPIVGVQFITQDDKDFITSDDNIFTTS